MKPKRTLYGIDPGTTQSALVVWTPDGRISSAIEDNYAIRNFLLAHRDDGHVYIEMFQCMGMAVGQESLKTVVWIGRFLEAATERRTTLILRNNVRMHMCGSPRAKDGNVAQSVRDKVGDKGSKRMPGPTYGVSSHGWQALAVAVTGLELYEK